jgi:hypothetical protein
MLIWHKDRDITGQKDPCCQTINVIFETVRTIKGQLAPAKIELKGAISSY